MSPSTPSGSDQSANFWSAAPDFNCRRFYSSKLFPFSLSRDECLHCLFATCVRNRLEGKELEPLQHLWENVTLPLSSALVYSTHDVPASDLCPPRQLYVELYECYSHFELC
jgi:hypothetical protein